MFHRHGEPSSTLGRSNYSPITKQESIELQKLGHRFGSEGTLHHTYTKHKKYYMTETSKALSDLNKIRKSRIVEK